MNDLTDKQNKLVEGLAQGLTKQEAGQKAGYGTTPGSTSAIVTETLKNPKVKSALQPYLEKHNLTIDRALKPLDKGLEAKKVDITGKEVDDLDTQIKSSDRVLRLMGVNNEQGGNFHLHLHNQRSKYSL